MKNVRPPEILMDFRLLFAREIEIERDVDVVVFRFRREFCKKTFDDRTDENVLFVRLRLVC